MKKLAWAIWILVVIWAMLALLLREREHILPQQQGLSVTAHYQAPRRAEAISLYRA